MFGEALSSSISEEAVSLLESEIIGAEGDLIIRTLPNNKSPGPDGIGYELYKQHREDLGGSPIKWSD